MARNRGFHLGRRAAEHDGAKGVMLAAARRGAQKGRERFSPRRREPIAPSPEQVAQRGLRAGGDDERQVAACMLRFGRTDRRRSEGGMRIGPAEAEGGDADQSLLSERNGGGAGQEIEISERDGRIRRLGAEGRRHEPVLERQHRLHEAGHARCRFEVADMALGRADGEGYRPCSPDGIPDRRGLGGIAHRRAGAMRLEVAEPVRTDAVRFVDAAQQGSLDGGIRQGEAVRPPVRVGGGGSDHSTDRIARPACCRQGLQHKHRCAFRPNIAVRLRAERTAASRRRDHSGPGEADKGKRGEEEVDSPDEGGLGPTGSEGGAGLMERDQGGGAGGVDRQALALEVEGPRQAIGEDGERRAGHRVRTDTGHVAQHGVGRVLRRGADKHRRLATAEPGGRNAGILQRLPGKLEQQQLLRVHLARFARRETEELGIP